MKANKITFFLFLVFNYSHAQTFNYTHYTVEDGLASSNVYVAFQDSKGFMWFGTENGVNRFDGKTFDTYTTENGLSDNDVLRIFEDSKGRIWFLSMGGHLSYFKDGKIYNEKTDSCLLNGYSGAGIFYAFEDNKKRIWFCSYNGVVSVLDDCHIFKIKVQKSLPDAGVCVDQDSSGKISIYSQGLTYIFNEDNRTISESGTFPIESQATYIKSSTGPNYFLSRDGIYKLSKGIISICLDFKELNRVGLLCATGDQQDNLYIGSQQGAYLVEKVAGQKGRILKYLKNEWVNSFSPDNEGNLWFMTRRNGIYLLPRQSRENKLFNSASLKNDNIQSLSIDDHGAVWIGSSEGQFACLIKDSIYNFSLSANMMISGKILNIEKDRVGNIWGCSDGHLYKINTGSENRPSKIKISADEASQRTLSISFNSRNEPILACPLFCATHSESENKIVVYPVKDQSYFIRTYFVFYDFSDRLFIANIDGLHERIGDKIINLGENDQLLRTKIVYIQQAPDSTLVLGTDGNGIIFYKNGHITKHLTRKDGIASDMCQKIKVYGDKIYVCTIKGLTQFTFNNNRVFDFVIYNKSNGLPSNDVRDVVVKDQFIYVGTSKGLSVLDTNEKKSFIRPPQIFIRSVINNTKLLDWNNPLNLEFKNNDLTVNFNAITFNNQEDLIYEYSLVKDSASWKSISSTSLSFPDIPIGKYLFSIRARKKESAWSDSQSFSFSVDPPFYKTWWFEFFIAFCFFGGLSLITIYLNRRRMRVQFLMLEKRNALNMERNRISADMHDDLGSDLSKIAVIAELIKIDNKADADVQSQLNKISEFVKSARKKMDDIIWALNPSNDSVGNLIGYINQYCLNFFEGTNTKVNINFELFSAETKLNARQRRNIFLVIKEIANNTLKHASASNFSLDIKTNEIEVFIKVWDDGIGLNASQKRLNSNGLNNIAKRIKELNGSINLVSEPGSGTIYEISFPINATL